jgi:hypothetical protein
MHGPDARHEQPLDAWLQRKGAAAPATSPPPTVKKTSPKAAR